MSMDRLVELFVESMPDLKGGPPTEEAVEIGISVVEKLVTSDDAVQMGGSPSATFVCLGMALEEKPMLSGAAIRCYEKALMFLSRRSESGWEKAVVLQQVGVVCIRQKRFEEAKQWLEECAEVVKVAPGHPRDAALFSGAFNTQQTRMQFAVTLEKSRAQVCAHLGDRTAAYQHIAEAQKLEELANGDAVERQAAQAELKKEQQNSGSKAAGSTAASGAAAAAAGAAVAGTATKVPAPNPNSPKELWAATPAETRRLKEYRYVDEGPTVAILLELNEHLGLGPEASELVEVLPQFRVKCEAESVDIQLRLRRKDGQVWHFQLLLDPLCKEIVPEDTVPKLRGKDGKRRLEVKLFKREKQLSWYGDIVGDPRSKKAPTGKDAKTQKGKEIGNEKAPPVQKGTLMNPLTPEELARLPTPSGTGSDNRPSTWQASAGGAPVRLAGPETPAPTSTSTSATKPFEPEPRHQKATTTTTTTTTTTDDSTAAAAAAAAIDEKDRNDNETSLSKLPPWVSQLEEVLDPEAQVEIRVHLGESAGKPVTMKDLELEVNEAARVLQLKVQSEAKQLRLDVPKTASLQGVVPKFRKATRVLELRFPNQA